MDSGNERTVVFLRLLDVHYADAVELYQNAEPVNCSTQRRVIDVESRQKRRIATSSRAR